MSVATKIKNYQPSPATISLIQSTPILLIVGPSGAGKDSLKTKLLTTDHYHDIVSHTTRTPRVNNGVLEQDGREYHFITAAQAEKMLDTQAFVEAKSYSGNVYGTSVSEIKAAKDAHKIAIADIEVQGVAEYKQLASEVTAIFLLPPSFDVWQSRLMRRYAGNEVDQADLRLRLQTGQKELDELLSVDYYLPVVNYSLDKAFETVEAITQRGEHTMAQKKEAYKVAKQLRKDIQDLLTNKII